MTLKEIIKINGIPCEVRYKYGRFTILASDGKLCDVQYAGSKTIVKVSIEAHMNDYESVTNA